MNEAKRINNLIHHIQGTCISLEEACNDLGFDREDLTMDELEELDNWVFQCDDCGWWYDCGDRTYNDEFGNTCIYCADGLEEGLNGYNAKSF